MQALAGLMPYSLMPIARLLRVEAPVLPWGTSVLLVSAIAAEPTRAAMLALRHSRREVAWLWMADTAPPVLPDIIIHHAPAKSDWQNHDLSPVG
jgi:hypothetical protein